MGKTRLTQEALRAAERSEPASATPDVQPDVVDAVHSDHRRVYHRQRLRPRLRRAVPQHHMPVDQLIDAERLREQFVTYG